MDPTQATPPTETAPDDLSRFQHAVRETDASAAFEADAPALSVGETVLTQDEAPAVFQPHLETEAIPWSHSGPDADLPSEAPEDRPAPTYVLREIIRLEASASSDVGCVRTNNEDSFGYNEAQGLYVVCDGMGGSASGEVASASAVSTILETFAASADSGSPTSTRLLEAIHAANHNVWQHGQTPEHKGMGTTLVAAALDGGKLIIGNVGDSRAYMVQSAHCMQLTVDHSYLNELIRNGTLSIENAHSADLNGMESVITRAIGAHSEVEPDFFSVDLHPGTTVLLATDGLTRYLLQDEIALVLINSPFESTCSNLIQLAKDRGGQDNITCLLLRAL
jgi:protein phosphatase